VTVRHHAPRPFETYPERADRSALGAASAERIFLGLTDEIVARLAEGHAATMLAEVEESEARKAGRDPHAGAACAAGCAFCCVLLGDDGGTITAHEAARLHAALAPLAGTPDGRDWHARACPALDPETRACRAYDARPSLCRAYHSTDAEACAGHLQGKVREGARLAGGHLSYLAAHGLARAALAGRAEVPTFSLRELAAAAVEGVDAPAALARARHGEGLLDAERRRMAKGVRDARAGRWR
jgi:Fe-S-cluster containining protein